MTFDQESENPCLAAALAFAELGFWVFPVPQGTKKSYKSAKTSNGESWGATNDVDEIISDWSTFPEANVGIATGHVSGIVVIDVDTLDGHNVDGIANFKALVEKHGELPETVCAKSPSGSIHYYFKYPHGTKVKKSTGKLAEGVDVLGDKAFVVAPPSIRPYSKQRYEWIRSPFETAFADMPYWLITGPSSKAEPAKLGQTMSDAMAVAMKAAKAVQAAPQGQRNDRLNAEAFKVGKLVAKGLIEQTMMSKLLSEAAMEVGLSEGEAKATIESAFQAANKEAEKGSITIASQDDLAMELGKHSFDQDARYSALEGTWFFWDSTRWLRDDTKRHMTLTRHFLRQTVENEDAKIRRQLLSASNIAAVECLARSNPSSAVMPEDFDRSRELLGTPGATINLRLGQQYLACRDDMITCQTAYAPEEGDPKLFLSFLDTIFEGDQEVIDFIQRLSGYALTGHVKDQKLIFFHGGGRNGKSVLLNVLQKVLADYACRMPASVLLGSTVERHPTDIASLHRARLAVGSEIPAGARWDETRIKDLTGGDRISARFMRQNYFTFDPQFTIIIAGNNRPEIHSVDEAIKRRVLLVPFNVTIPSHKVKPDLEEKLLTEEAGMILSWMIAGAKAWFEMGLKPPSTILKASADYIADQDEFSQFLLDETEADPDGFAATAGLANRFNTWAQHAGCRKMSPKAINNELKKRGYSYEKKANARGFTGLKITPSHSPHLPTELFKI